MVGLVCPICDTCPVGCCSPVWYAFGLPSPRLSTPCENPVPSLGDIYTRRRELAYTERQISLSSVLKLEPELWSVPLEPLLRLETPIYVWHLGPQLLPLWSGSQTSTRSCWHWAHGPGRQTPWAAHSTAVATTPASCLQTAPCILLPPRWWAKSQGVSHRFVSQSESSESFLLPVYFLSLPCSLTAMGYCYHIRENLLGVFRKCFAGSKRSRFVWGPCSYERMWRGPKCHDMEVDSRAQLPGLNSGIHCQLSCC